MPATADQLRSGAEATIVSIVATPDRWELEITVAFARHQWTLEPDDPPLGLWDRTPRSRWRYPWKIVQPGRPEQIVGSLSLSGGSANRLTITLGDRSVSVPPAGSADMFLWGERSLRLVDGQLFEGTDPVASFTARAGSSVAASVRSDELEPLAGAIAAGFVLRHLVLAYGP